MIHDRKRRKDFCFDDLMLCRWENEGGGLGPVVLANEDRSTNGRLEDLNRDELNVVELELVPSLVDFALSDSLFVERLARSYRNGHLGRNAHRDWRWPTTPGCSREELAALGHAG